MLATETLQPESVTLFMNNTEARLPRDLTCTILNGASIDMLLRPNESAWEHSARLILK